MSFDTPDNEIQVNDTFSVNLFAETTTDSDAFFSWDLSINFDSSIFNLDSLVLGDEFVSAPNTNLEDLSATLPLSLANPFFPSISGDDILLISFNFTALAAGTSELFTSLGNNDAGFTSAFLQPLDATHASTSLTVQGANEVPEPGALLLMLLTSLSLMAFRRKA
ncbi:cohesin domain-containing protein [Thalassomonas sp. RHCl1]|uniref:cohesin domain-containing protein n=1 Tax=Thalassomonas sp. RHCl1 TaxID=2995320 RepID=UPI00248B0800|nr:cohesin domain-containing protein [Thalassomonas sp. RHCl1]